MDLIMELNIENEIQGIQAKNESLREKYFIKLISISETNPRLLHSYWHIIEKILKESKTSNKYFAIHIIANLILVDDENKFYSIFDYFYSLINHEDPAIALHIAGASGKIIKAKPELSDTIINILLNIETTSKCNQLESQIGYIIDSMDYCYNKINLKNEMMEFIKKQLSSRSPKTRIKAKKFLEKYNNNYNLVNIGENAKNN